MIITTKQNLLLLLNRENIPWFDAQPKNDNDSFSDIQIIRSCLDKIGPLPAGSVVLGLGKDNYPLLLNLYDPKPGAVLIIGDPGCGKTRLLISLLQSANLLNFGKISLDLIASKTYSPDVFELPSHRFESYYPHQSDIKDRILSLALIARQRLNGRLMGPSVLLAIDDLFLLQSYLDKTTLKELEWLIQNGASVRIWTFATASTIAFENIRNYTAQISEFKTIIFGSISNPALVNSLTGNHFIKINDVLPEGEFYVPYRKSWLGFSGLTSLSKAYTRYPLEV